MLQDVGAQDEVELARAGAAGPCPDRRSTELTVLGKLRTRSARMLSTPVTW